MRRYECIYILKPDLPTEAIDELGSRFREVIEQNGGRIINEDHWGIKSLAYEVKKLTRGYYILLDYAADGTVATELERNFKMLEDVIRFQTILQDESVSEDSLDELIESVKEKAKPVSSDEEAESSQGADDESGEGSDEDEDSDEDDDSDDDDDEEKND